MSGLLAEPVTEVASPSCRISDVTGQKRRNLLRWQKLGLSIKRIYADACLAPEEISVQSLNQKMTCSIINNINDKEIQDA